MAGSQKRQALNYIGKSLTEKPWVMDVGSTWHQSVEEWDKIEDIPIARRAKAPSVIQPPDIPGWTAALELEYWELYGEMRKAILKSEGKPGLGLWTNPSELVDDVASDAAYQIAHMIEKDRKQLTLWEATQIQRCVKGFGCWSPRHYMYYHFGKIESDEARGMISPRFRIADEFGWRLIESGIESKEGRLAVKRRRFGFTWILVWLMLHEMCLKGGKVFFTSHSDDAIINFIDRIRLARDAMPRFMKPIVGKDARDGQSMLPNLFVMNVLGIDPVMASDSFLRTASPRNESGFTGTGTSILAIDEVGEIPNIFDVLEWATPMLADDSGYYRQGFLLMFGTVGKMEKAGKYVKALRDNPATFRFKPYLVPGHLGVKPDARGNDQDKQFWKDLEREVQAKKDAGRPDLAIATRQKYPRDWDDAFLRAASNAAWPVEILEEMRDRAAAAQMDYGYGVFYQHGAEIRFEKQEPNPTPENKEWLGYNQWIIIEPRQVVSERYENYYIATVDPVDFDKDQYQESEISYMLSDYACSIYRRHPHGDKPPQIVAIYVGREKNLNSAFHQAMLGAKFYGAKINFERQKAGRNIAYINQQNDPSLSELIAYGTGTVIGLSPSDSSIGFSASPTWWSFFISSGRRYLYEHGPKVLTTIRFCDEAFGILKQNTDVMITFGGNILWDEDLRAREKMGAPSEKTGNTYDSMSPWKRINGRLVNTNYGKPPQLRKIR